MSGRSTPAQHGTQQRHSRNLAHIRKAQLNDPRPRSSDNVLASLRATQIVASKPVLPAELIATILDYLPVPDLMRFALVSRRLCEMVYDDTRWIQKLKAMGVWNEHEARQRLEDTMKRKADAHGSKEVDEIRRTGLNGTAGGGRPHAGSVTLFDAGIEEERHRDSVDRSQKPSGRRRTTLSDGFDELNINSSSTTSRSRDSSDALTILNLVKSIRGRARQEFGKVYGALGPLYVDLARSNSHSDALIFRVYRDPEHQAQVLANLKRFARCDLAQGWQQREQKLDSMIGMFENAVLREFEQGYAAGDVDDQMHRYAHVLDTIGASSSAVDTFISNHPIMAHNIRAGDPLDCLEAVAPGHVDLNPSQAFFEKLAIMMVDQAVIIDRVFPPTTHVLEPFLSRLCQDIIADYLTALFDEAHLKGVETYVKAVSGTFEQSQRFVASLKPTKASPTEFYETAKYSVTQCYEKHIDLYLAEELAIFRTKSEAEVKQWEKEQSDQEASSEAFFMSNLTRQAAKRDFLSSFKKVVMMPVNVLPAFPLSSPFATGKPAPAPTSAVVKSTSNLAEIETAYSRPRTPTLNGFNTPSRASTPMTEPPTSELAAKAAIMNSRLEGIRSLFSIEVALNLTHFAKASIERAAGMIRMGGRQGDDAKVQCEAIFVTMLGILGDRHVKNGFDKAVGHLGNYDPRQVRDFQTRAIDGQDRHDQAVGVEPLVTFLELVNVGDLIQQMIEVFYAQELVATKITDRDDFLDPAVKEKKRFEQMLDERVAAGLNKGIDVLMDEVEYICASTQQATDFNPSCDKDEKNGTTTSNGVFDIGPSDTAKQVVNTISSHTSMLVGSTDKNMLDVFMQEVGLRLFGVLCKHFKRQRISVDGAIKLICDINHYSSFIATLRQKPLSPYFQALRELAQIYLIHIDPPGAYFSHAKGARASIFSTKASKTSLQAKELAAIVADTQRYGGVLTTEEVYNFVERRADYHLIKSEIDQAMYGIGCAVM